MLAAHPGDVTHTRQVFKAHMMRGYALGHPDYFNLGRRSEALENFRAAMRIAQRLLDADPRNALAIGDVADANAAIAVTLTGSNPKLARDMLTKALDHNLKLVLGSPNTLAFLHNTANSHYALAAPLAALGERAAAIRHLHEAVRLQRVIAAARPNQPGLRHNMMDTLAPLGEVRLDAHDLPGASAAIEEAVAIAATVPRDAAFYAKITSIAASFAAMGRLRAATGSADALGWYRKSLDLWEELGRSGVNAEYVRVRKAPVELALAQYSRSSR